METVTLKYKATYYDHGQMRIEEYWLDGKLHNPNGIACRYWHRNGHIISEVSYKHGKLHNPNGVALRTWFDNGQIATEQYYLNNKFHNLNGVALKSWNPSGVMKIESYYINGVKLTKEEFENRNNPKPCDNKTVEVDGIKYKLKAI